uniref:uncharacterized protein LOC109970992 isoform X1 n=1 Tax=Monopterus albus TaxID=43700 RepID=UPI0009B4AD25|nr:uncharacterized protein LOC109970992 isoform X1 [Monopterus albus]
MGDVSEGSLLDYFYTTGGNSGRVKNADMLRTFKPFIGHSDLHLRAKYREEFKLIIDRIAVVKSENGEKYLVLKKKYRQLLQERDTKHHGTDGARTTATVQWDASAVSTYSPHHKQQQDELMSCGEPSSTAEDQQTGTHSMQHVLPQPPAIQIQEPSAQSNREDELDKDSGSKSESEQDEEGTSSMGSVAVALDPIEKEWIYSAAGARVPDLSQLLRQDPSLANKKEFTSGFVSTSFAHHSCLVFLHIQESVRHTGLCVSCRCEPSLAAVSPIGELVAGTERPVSDQTGGGSPRLAGSETRGAGRENVASCSASSITPAQRETRRAAYQTALSSIRLKI